MNETITTIISVIGSILTSLTIYYLESRDFFKSKHISLKRNKYKKYIELLKYLDNVDSKKYKSNKILRDIQNKITPLDNQDYYSHNLRNILSKFDVQDNKRFEIQLSIFSKYLNLELEKLRYELGYESHIKYEKSNLILIIIAFCCIFISSILSAFFNSIYIILLFVYGLILLIMCMFTLYFSYTSITTREIRKLKRKLRQFQKQSKEMQQHK